GVTPERHVEEWHVQPSEQELHHHFDQEDVRQCQLEYGAPTGMLPDGAERANGARPRAAWCGMEDVHLAGRHRNGAQPVPRPLTQLVALTAGHVEVRAVTPIYRRHRG